MRLSNVAGFIWCFSARSARPGSQSIVCWIGRWFFEVKSSSADADLEIGAPQIEK
jgi:hypothetical protein